MESIWGEEFNTIDNHEQTKKILNKIKSPKKAPKVMTEKSLKSKTVSIAEKLNFITQNVLRILGVYKENTQVIKTKEELVAYIDAAINNGVIAVDTETNNSLEPITCKLMGPCIYTPGQKNAYIPINHVDKDTRERLEWQLTENDIAEQFNRLTDTKIIFHNAKFDYQVIKCTTGVELSMYWDTLIGAKILDENERAGLKQQYIQKIDPSIEKYDIENLFEGIEYAVVDPDIFALYAATDAFMTYKLYLWQLSQFEKPDNQKIYHVFKDIEMPVIVVAAEMELSGVSIDIEYSKRLSEKYHKKSEALDIEINAELEKYSEQIAKWRTTKEATFKPTKKSKSITVNGVSYTYIDASDGPGDVSHWIETSTNREVSYTEAEILGLSFSNNLGKSKSEQLSDPPAISSPTQLAILFYDVLGIKPVDKKSPRGTGEEILTKINEKYKIPLCDLILQKRGLEKLIGTYIDKLPACVCPKDNRLHAHFNQYGAGCVVGNTQILTDNGYINIKDMFDGTEADGEFYEHNMRIVNKNLEYENMSHKIAYYNCPTKKITLRGGFSIEGTYNHPIICSSLNKSDIKRNKSKKQITRLPVECKFKKLEEIVLGDIVAIPFGYNRFPLKYNRLSYSLEPELTNSVGGCVMPEVIDERFAEMLGMYHADGTMLVGKGHFRVRLCNKDEEVKQKFSSLVESLFNIKCNIYKDCAEFSCTQLSSLKDIFKHGARNKTVPDIIKQSPRSVICSYIKGLTLDSSFDVNRQRLFISCANIETAYFIQSVLLNIGIIPQFRRGLYNFNKDHMGNDVDFLPVIRIGVSGEMYKKFIDEIGVEEKHKAITFDTYKKSTYLTYENVYYAYVDKIEESNNTVYDIHVPDTHSFISNGIISHNTGRFSSSDPNL